MAQLKSFQAFLKQLFREFLEQARRYSVSNFVLNITAGLMEIGHNIYGLFRLDSLLVSRTVSQKTIREATQTFDVTEIDESDNEVSDVDELNFDKEFDEDDLYDAVIDEMV